MNQNEFNQNNSESTFVSQISLSGKKVRGAIGGKIKKFKKQLLILVLIGIIILGGVFLYNKFIGFEELSWDEKYLSIDTKYITQSNVKLGVKFSNEEKKNDIKWKTNCGEIEGEGLEVTWKLSDVIGKCEISASYKLKKIKRNIQVIPYDFDEKPLGFEYKIDLDSDEDLDFDNLTNKQEKEYNTNPELADSDLDGLDDDYEIFTSKTDPNKKDSDNDGLSDYDEVKLGLNPLKTDSKNDGIKDGERELTYNYDSDKLKLSITGKGNIASTVTEVNSNTKISGKKGIIDNLYTLYTEGTIKEATLTITYTDEELIEKGLNEDNLSVYYYNEKESKYEKVDSVVDKENKVVTAKLKHFSNYVLADSTLISETTTNQVLFVLDNSWSMYTNQQYEKYTGKKYSGGLFSFDDLDGFDAEGKRFTLTSELVSKLSEKNYQLGLSEFRYDYANALPIGSSAASIKEKLTDMTGKFITKSEGTNITNALLNSIKDFSKDSDNKYIVILTDGQDSSLSSKVKTIVEKANESNVRICSIGFGGGSYNSSLEGISSGTGCKFYSSSDVNGLAELFDNIGTELNDNLVDIDGDNKVDGILLADSGFVVNRDGFSFENYESNLTGGHCHGMATFAELYYKKVLPLKVAGKVINSHTSYDYDLSKTYFKNYDNLYDYKLKTNSLKYEVGFEHFNEDTPTDFRSVNGKVLIINDKYKKELTNSGIYDVYEIEDTRSKKERIEKYGIDFSKKETFMLNENLMQKSSKVDSTDLQLFNAIYTSHIKQHISIEYSSASSFILAVRNFVGSSNTETLTPTRFIDVLKYRLNDGDPVTMGSDYDYGWHAINAINLIQDIDNPNLYYIGVYDNRYPGEKKYVNLECNNDKCVTKANKDYSKSNQALRITPSIDYDLSYYQD